jgi:hypothetical protein
MNLPPEPDHSPDRPSFKPLLEASQWLVRWSPIGGSGFLFIHFLWQQAWMQSLVTFPGLVLAAVWAAYSKNFVAQLQEIYGERGKRDASDLVKWLDSLDEALRWRLSSFEAQYLKAQAEECLDYEIEGFDPGSSKLELETVFVPLQLHENPLENCADRFVPAKLAELVTREQIEEIEALKNSSQEIWDVLAEVRPKPRRRRMAVVAAVGYGKTTLMRHITLSFARNLRSKSLRTQLISPFARSPKANVPKLIPFLLRLRKFRQVFAQFDAAQSSSFLPLPDLINQHHIPALWGGQQLNVPAYWVKQLLNRGEALILLDGFDEVPEDRLAVVSQWITEQMRSYPEAVFILTSRPSGYERYRTEKPPTTLYIRPFEPDQRDRFIRQWYLSQEIRCSGRDTPYVQGIAKERADGLIQQIEQRRELTEMAQNPLLLTMIANIHRFVPKKPLPKRQVDLYQRICTLQLEDRPAAKGIPLLLSNGEQRQSVLQRLALTMLKAEQCEISQSQALDWIQEPLDRFTDQADPQKFLQEMVEVVELLAEKATGLYEFAHLSFQEYLAATELKQQNQIDLLAQNLSNSRWSQTLLLYAAQADPTPLIQAACCQTEPEAWLMAYRCAAESPYRVDPGLIDQLQTLRYQQLDHYLKNGEWRNADKETYRLMITTLGKTHGSLFDQEDLLNFPCGDLRWIDQLWVQHSGGQFGFSVQKKIWQECGSPMDYNRDWEKFGDRVGWRVNNDWKSYSDLDLELSTSAPKGHLPVWLGVGGCVGGFVGVVTGYGGSMLSLLSHRDL